MFPRKYKEILGTGTPDSSSSSSRIAGFAQAPAGHDKLFCLCTSTFAMRMMPVIPTHAISIDSSGDSVLCDTKHNPFSLSIFVCPHVCLFSFCPPPPPPPLTPHQGTHETQHPFWRSGSVAGPEGVPCCALLAAVSLYYRSSAISAATTSGCSAEHLRLSERSSSRSYRWTE